MQQSVVVLGWNEFDVDMLGNDLSLLSDLLIGRSPTHTTISVCLLSLKVTARWLLHGLQMVLLWCLSTHTAVR